MQHLQIQTTAPAPARRSKAGRPRKSVDTSRTERVSVYLSAAEHAAIKAAALAAKLSPSDYFRRGGLSPVALQSLPAICALTTALNRVGINLNQFVRAYGRNPRTTPFEKELASIVEQLSDEHDAILVAVKALKKEVQS